MMISARNQIDVSVEEVHKGVVNSHVVLKTAQGTEMIASITNGAVEAMGLRPGEKVVAFFKASHVLIATGWAMTLSARNKLGGTITTLERGAVNAEVALRLPGGDILTAIITNEAAQDLALKEGDEVVAIIKATDVMIAK